MPVCRFILFKTDNRSDPHHVMELPLAQSSSFDGAESRQILDNSSHEHECRTALPTLHTSTSHKLSQISSTLTSTECPSCQPEVRGVASLDNINLAGQVRGQRIDSVVDLANKDSDGSVSSINRKLDITPSSLNSKRGMILLGRGNSFSFGRPEAILLPPHHKLKRAATVQGNNFNFSKEQEQTCADSNNNKVDHLDQPVTSQGQLFRRLSLHTPPALDLLWQKAESLMVAKQPLVEQVLEEFGIREVTGAEQEEEDLVMEEEVVWRMVQEASPVK